MTWVVSIAAAVTVAVTVRLVYVIFLSGRALTNASFFGRILSVTEQAREAFSQGWRAQSWRYRLIAYPCIVVSVGAVSFVLYKALGFMEKFDTWGEILPYCFVVFVFGVSVSLILSFVLMFAVYFLVSIIRGSWNKKADTPSPS